jgi:hypothetical protein
MEPLDIDARRNIKTQTGFLRKMVKVCKNVCIDFNSQADLNITEKSCIERCAVKYLMVGEYVSKHYHKEMQSQVKQG